MTVLDAVIVGQGLAGTALAWTLIDAGLSCVVLDDDAPVSASKVSAGLFTPIMGKNFTRNDDAAIVAAGDFYRAIEARTNTRFLRDIQAVRLFATTAERALWDRRREPLMGYLATPQPNPLLPPDRFRAPYGGFVMRSSQLDTATYLAASRAALPVAKARIDARADIHTDGALLRVGEYKTRHVIFCEGFAGSANPYFPHVSYRSAKGETLLIRLVEPLAPVSIHRRMWMAPTADPAVFRVGATFDWANFDHMPTASGRDEIEAEVREILVCSYDVADHIAAVRPIIGRGVRMGASPFDARILMFNGLGTKGATRAPKAAADLMRHIRDGVPLPMEVAINQAPTPAFK